MTAKDMLGQAIKRVIDLSVSELEVLIDLLEKITNPEWFRELKKFLRKEPCWTEIAKKVFLRLISVKESLTLDAVDGTELISNAKKVFRWIDPDFKNWDANESGLATEETPVEVHEMVEDGMLSQIFNSVSVGDLNQLCLTQHQIISFVVKHKDWLRKDGYGTFFLFQSKGKFFVASVRFRGDGSLDVNVDLFEDSGVWIADGRPRVVVPKLA